MSRPNSPSRPVRLRAAIVAAIATTALSCVAFGPVPTSYARAGGPCISSAPADPAQPAQGGDLPRHAATESWLVELRGPTVMEKLEAHGRPPVGPAGAGSSFLSDNQPGPLAAAFRAAIELQQQPAWDIVAASGGTVVDSYQVVANGLLVHAAAEQASEMARSPLVEGVWRVPPQMPDLAESVPHIGVTRALEELGFNGEGALIAIVDAGIDYTHAAFGGPGTRRDYEANDENILEPGSFPTAKVVGGYDFAGHRYSPNCGLLPAPFPQCDVDPHPDPDPLEPIELAHGTAVAAIAAGEGTQHLHPGVARAARLVALKVYGNPIGAPPATDLGISALEWIVSHNLGLEVPGTPPPGKIDVANLSFGRPWASGLPPIERAVAAATEAGVLVVTSVGDGGPIPFVASQPGAAESALSVASSYPPGRGRSDHGLWADWVGADGAGRISAPTIEANFTPQLGFTGPMTEALALYGLACDDDEGRPAPPEQDVAEKVALIERGDCSFYDKLWNAADLGSLAAVVFTDDREMTVMACEPPSDCSNPPGIPAVMIDQQSGSRLRELLRAGAQVTVALNADLEVEVENLTDTISPFSSRGPSRHGRLVPLVTAPGSEIVSAMAGCGDWAATRSGSSMAAPFVSGVGALGVQLGLESGIDLGPYDLASLIVNYASPVVRVGDGDSGDRAAVARQGAGRLNAWDSLRAPAVLRQERAMPALSFGHLHVVDEAVRLERELVIRALAATEQGYTSTFRFADPENDLGRGVSVATELIEPPGPDHSARLRVRLDIDPDALRPWNLRGFNVLANEAAVGELEIDGFVELFPNPPAGSDEPPTARVPLYLLPHRHSCVSPDPGGAILWLEGGSRTQVLTNDCGAPGTAEVFTLVGTDPSESAAQESFPEVLDIDAVGVRFAPTTSVQQPGIIEWAIHTSGPRRLPSETEFRIYVDLDEDGQFDRVVFNRLGRYVINLPEMANRWVVAHAPVVPGSIEPDFDEVSTDVYAQRFDLDETVSLLQVGTDSLGLETTDGAARLRFAVMALEAAGDFPLTSTYPGHDMAPDDLPGGGSYAYDSDAVDCLGLTGQGAAAATAPTQGLSLPPLGSETLTLEFGCSVDRATSGGAAGLLISLPSNSPSPEQASIRRFVAPHPSSPVYLPTVHSP